MRLPLTRRILLWALLGPFFLVATLLAVLVQAQSMVVPAVLGLLGLSLCWQWRMAGLGASIFLLFSYMAFVYATTPSHEQFWYMGTTLSLAVSLIITTLCLEEIESTALSMQVESKSRLDSLVRVDEKRRETEKAWQKDRADFVQRLQEARSELHDRDSRIAIYQKQLSLSRQEIEEVSESKQKVLRRLDTVQVRMQQLQETLLQKESEGECTEELEQQKRLAVQRLNMLNQLRGEHFQLQIHHEAKPNSYWQQSQRLRDAEGRYLQLRQQFAEKQTVLEAARKELYEANEHCLLMEKQNTERALEEQPVDGLSLAALQEALSEEEREKKELLQSLKSVEKLTASLMAELASQHTHCLF